MKELKFTPELEQACLDGIKTQARRPRTHQNCPYGEIGTHFLIRGVEFEITNIRVERVQDITEEDARAEGIIDGGCLNCGESEPCNCGNPLPDARDLFIYLWDFIYADKYPWYSNPWVWVIEFRRVKA